MQNPRLNNSERTTMAASKRMKDEQHQTANEDNNKSIQPKTQRKQQTNTVGACYKIFNQQIKGHGSN